MACENAQRLILPLRQSLENLVASKPEIRQAIHNDFQFDFFALQKVGVLLEFYSCMAWYDSYEKNRDDDQYPDMDAPWVYQIEDDRSLTFAPCPAHKKMQIQVDKIGTLLRKGIYSSTLGSLRQLSFLFLDKAFNRALIHLTKLIFPLLTLKLKSEMFTLIFYGILGANLYSFSIEDVDTKLADYFGRQVMSLIDGFFHEDSTDIFCNHILFTYFSALSNKDWLCRCFGETTLIDEGLMHKNPFYYDTEELYTELFVANRWSLIPLMKRMGDALMAGKLR
jgi:hypothetical protein